jgi:hypothetical protein
MKDNKQVIMPTVPTEEITYTWEELPPRYKDALVHVHADALNTPRLKLLRLFELCRPKSVFGRSPNGSISCKIHADSVDAVNVCLRQYL